jgi:hypothetical protein
VKRRGKSPPPAGQPAGHDKPHAVQGQTETPGRLPGREGDLGARLGYRSHACRLCRTPRGGVGNRVRREMNDHRRCAFSKRAGTEFGLRPEQRGALRETAAPFACPTDGSKILAELIETGIGPNFKTTSLRLMPAGKFQICIPAY